MQKLISQLKRGPISQQEAGALQAGILEGKVTSEQMLEMFAAFDARPITEQELLGFFVASKKSMLALPVHPEALDTCGTGGDGMRTFNISTLAAVVAAACGVKVAKHGNKSATSKCGSADVLDALGVKIDLTPEQAEKCLQRCGLTFMFAPKFHPAFKNAVKARKIFGQRTYFNLLGPLLNPASAGFRLVGVADPKVISLMGRALIDSGVSQVWLLSSTSGMDEISPCEKTKVNEYAAGSAVREFEIDPQELGLALSDIKDLQIENLEQAKAIFLAVLNNIANVGQTNAVLLNTAAALALTGQAEGFRDGLAQSKKALISGAASRKFKEFAALTQNI